MLNKKIFVESSWMPLAYGLVALVAVLVVWGEPAWMMRVVHNVAEAGIALSLFNLAISKIPDDEINKHRQSVMLGQAIVIAVCFT